MKKKSYKCLIDLDGFRKTKTGKQKIWRTDAIRTFCCEIYPSYLVWERSTKWNDYDPYVGYVSTKNIWIISDKLKGENNEKRT